MNAFFPLSIFLRAVPDKVHTLVLANAANLLIKDQTIRNELEYLEGKRIVIRITDSDTELEFKVQARQFIPSYSRLNYHTRISGTIRDLLALFFRQQDSDTLFFNRRLCLEGETETGLYLKNVLDSAEFELHRFVRTYLGRRLATIVLEINEQSSVKKIKSALMQKLFSS